MKTFNVVWEEKHSVNVEAKNEKEAIEKVYDCDYDEIGVNAEISTPPEAFEIELS